MNTIPVKISSKSLGYMREIADAVGDAGLEALVSTYQNMLLDIMKRAVDTFMPKPRLLSDEDIVIQITRSAEPLLDKTIIDIRDIICDVRRDPRSLASYTLIKMVITTSVAAVAFSASRSLGCLPRVDIKLGGVHERKT
jgi:hypothetical protein